MLEIPSYYDLIVDKNSLSFPPNEKKKEKITHIWKLYNYAWERLFCICLHFFLETNWLNWNISIKRKILYWTKQIYLTFVKSLKECNYDDWGQKEIIILIKSQIYLDILY